MNPPMVQVQTMATPGTEFGATSGRLMISRNTGNFSTTVYYTLTRRRFQRLDYITVPTQIVIGPGQVSANVTIALVLDSAEGDETVTLTITPHADAVVWTNGSTNLTITDRPIDSWRFGRFSAGELRSARERRWLTRMATRRRTSWNTLNLDPKSSNAITAFRPQIENVSGTDASWSRTSGANPRDIDYVLEVSRTSRRGTRGGVAQEPAPATTAMASRKPSACACSQM